MTGDTRLQRGRSYARKGAVSNLTILPGIVVAKVSGSRSKPYQTDLQVPVFDAATWQKIIEILSARAEFVAKLLSGKMPDNIEDVFKTLNISLIPKIKEISIQCNCPDGELPCKHLAAVFYVWSSQFDQDPFLIFELRGKNKAQLLYELSAARNQHVKTALSDEQTDNLETGFPEKSIFDIKNNFWDFASETPAINIQIAPPKDKGTLVKSLGTPPDWVDGEAFIDAVVEIQRQVSLLIATGKLFVDKK